MSAEIPMIVLDHDPVPGIDYFEGQNSSAQDPRSSVEKKHPGRIKKNIKRAAYLAGALVLTAGVLQIKDWIDGFNGIEATEKTELTVGPATNTIRTNQYVNLAEITSKFPLEVKTSLDRPGPVNCDMKIIMKDKDEQVETITNTGLVFSEIDTVKNEDGTYNLIVSGNMKVTPSSVNWHETPILFERDLSMFDACFNMDEPNQAMDIAVTTTLEAGQLATACAIDSKEGEEAIYEALKQDAKMHGNIPKETSNDNIVVDFTNLNEQQDALYGKAVKQFDEVVGDKLDQYLDIGDHNLVTNFEGIKDCDQHKYIFDK